ncbi:MULTISPECIES: glycosyltransferase [Butyricimonas]|jgi:glycosyltransferase involved in cell wall biosynthesis|uniref:Glycosyltransferase n=1 Tax=Butyricimonas virosa TaxID=544645 RepID=A0A415QP31_9BACT|nr:MULTISPECIES: glycosyltransferase [Butyricimonas]MBR5296855.1 glycosyltransferase [Parabacteroides sp.]MBO4957257.1 glycosyltransferase [Butyricimonas sp.]MCI6413340.1 glycosyltransferase [Butyricimonas virosa]MCI7165288.1 glycosyltransferase [Butyricimonas virosa]MCI7295221.1 glycosyltransferase [Butyricimonas virosa]
MQELQVNKENCFSVLMAVYKKEQPLFFKEALRSVFEQSLIPNEVVLVKDGPLTEELEQIIVDFSSKNEQLKVITLEKNQGLGEALRIGLNACSFDLVARMDSDDICKPYRFEKQIAFLKEHKEITIVGSWIEEFSDCKEEIEAIRELPQEDKQLKIFMKWRNPFNHMTVMFRKKDILAVGGYQPFYLLEDYYLWNRLANANYYFANIGESLLWARGGYTMLERRGGWKYVVSESKLLKFMYRSGRINIVEFGANLMMKSIIRLIGKHLRHTIYTFFLRKKVTKTSVSV